MASLRNKLETRAGKALTSLAGGMLAVNLLMIIGLLALLAWEGLGHFKQQPLERIELTDGRAWFAEVKERAPLAEREGFRLRLKVGNRDLDGTDFLWVDEDEILTRTLDPDVYLLERLEWGNFHGRLKELRRGDVILGGEDDFALFGDWIDRKRALYRDIDRFERKQIGPINYRIEKLRLHDASPTLVEAEQVQYEKFAEQLFRMRAELTRETVIVEAADGRLREFPIGDIVRAVQPNQLDLLSGTGVYLSRVREFLLDDPREANTQGGIFPAIFGTVMMVFLMTVLVAPLGVLAALFLREYAKQGPLVRIIRIAVNNLAGVPSIVFGIFGLGFFVYLTGGTIDQLFFSNKLPTPTFGTGGIFWASLTLALLTLPVVIVSAEEGLSAVPRSAREGSLALGATKFETTWRVVVPAAAPGIMTGLILAMARAAGEVAPLMIVGMVKLAPALPVDGTFPFLHLDRKFMHLGFHVYDLGFQSPNVESVKPLVYSTALVLVILVGILNLTAVLIRNHLRNKYKGNSV